MVKRRDCVTTTRKKVGEKQLLPIVFLSSGIGYRMKSYGPKPLIKIHKEQNILEKQIEEVEKVYPNSEIILVTGFESEKIARNVDQKIRIVENRLYQTTNEAEELRLALQNIISDQALVIQGDIVFDYFAVEGLCNDNSSVLVDSLNRMPKDNVGVTSVNNVATIFSYGLDIKWGGMVYLAGKEFKLAKKICSITNEKLYLHEILNRIIEKRGSFKTIEQNQMKIHKIDSKNIETLRNE